MQNNRKFFTPRLMAKISILSVLAAALMFLEIPLWFAPSFYEIDLSEVVVLIGGFALGPVAAIIIELIKVFVFVVIKGSATGGIGEAANFLVGCSFVVPAAFFYRRRKCMKTAIFGMLVGTILMATVGGFVNAYLLLPVYAKVFGMDTLQPLIDMGSAVNATITDLTTFVLFAVVPFNVVKGVLSSAIALLVYKRVSPILHK